jgi:hypothetical protein
MNRGGDKVGKTPIHVTQGKSTPVAAASYDANYASGVKLDATEEDLKKGYCTKGY